MREQLIFHGLAIREIEKALTNFLKIRVAKPVQIQWLFINFVIRVNADFKTFKNTD